MKKALVLTLLLSGLLFYGCGSKGGTAAPANGSNSSSSTGGAAFALNMVDSSNAQNVASKITITGTPPDPSHVRVVIRSFATVTTTQLVCPNNDYNDNTGECNVAYEPTDVGTFQEVYRDIQDVPYSGATVTIGIPQGTGFTLDVITYRAETSNNSILKYGQITDLDTNTSNSATVIMNTVADILQMKVSLDTVLPNQTFAVAVNNVMPFAPIYNMIMSFGTTTPVVKTTGAKTTTFTAPVTYDSGQTVALQGQFTLDRSCLKVGESASWKRLFPNPDYSEEVYSNLTPLVVVSLPGI